MEQYQTDWKKNAKLNNDNIASRNHTDNTNGTTIIRKQKKTKNEKKNNAMDILSN